MTTNHFQWSVQAQRWVARLDSDPADLLSPGTTHETLNSAALLASVGHDDLAGLLLRAWNAAMSRRVTADAS